MQTKSVRATPEIEGTGAYRQKSWKILGVKSEILKRYIAVMSVLRGYPRVAAIVLLVYIKYILYSMKYQVLSERVRQKDVLARRVSFCCLVLGYDIVERGKGQLMS